MPSCVTPSRPRRHTHLGVCLDREGPKGVKSQIQGDELRVQSKSRDDLQEVMRVLRAADLDLDLQFINYR